MFKKIALAAVGIAILLIITLITLQSPVNPVAYNAPAKPAMTGVLAPNDLLQKAELLAKGQVNSPEEIAVDEKGRLYFGTPTGTISRLLSDGVIETFATTGGRPLGMKFDTKGNLIVADAYKGLLSIDPRGTVSILATSAEGVPFKCTDALDVANNGTVYFTDASDKFPLKDFLLDMLEARPHGRLMRYDPFTGKVTVLISSLRFANGVALSRNEDFVLVNETYTYSIHRYWLAGPKAGTSDIFIENLPGFPDNISSNGKGKFWLALFTTRNGKLDTLHKYPKIKYLLGKIPASLWSKSKRYGFVVALDEQGNITGTFQDPTGKHLYNITSAQEYGGYLYIGSLHSNRIGKLKIEE
ncbi:MAG: gluconolactonase [Deltaproteobacteria bacterium HGW-Deltaproteobacteria-2]|jgi:sugar lactone lactonase YvrE|nr:MAG: gluconolactonase [Deltaproteobacteria bacterium HGW-Deltaproteobacteria-2]